MKLGTQLFKGGLQLGGTQMLSQGCAFLRNLIVARLLSPADFGLAATFAITIALMEMLGSLSAEKLIIQAEDGDEMRFQGAAQLLLVGRGLFAGLSLAVLATFIARLFGAPASAWAFRWLGLIPAIRGLMHLDIHRFQRKMKFGAVARVELVANLAAVLAAWPIAAWRRDYSAMLWLMVGQAIVATAASHVLAERKYSIFWDRAYASRVIHFGWPLMFNSLLLFTIFQGDRFIIGSASKIFHKPLYNFEDLGVYSAAFSLTLAPALIVGSIGTSLLLPVFSRLQRDTSQFALRYATSAEVLALVSGAFALSMVAAGGWVITVTYGHRYAAASQAIGWLGVMQTLRMLRVTPTMAAMARGDTKNALIANLARSLALFGTLVIASRRGSLALLAASGFGGELLALLVSLNRLRRVSGISPWPCLKPALLSGFLVLLATGVSVALPKSIPFLPPVVAAAFLTLFTGIMIASFPRLRNIIRPLVIRITRRDPVVALAPGLPR